MILIHAVWAKMPHGRGGGTAWKDAGCRSRYAVRLWGFRQSVSLCSPPERVQTALSQRVISSSTGLRLAGLPPAPYSTLQHSWIWFQGRSCRGIVHPLKYRISLRRCPVRHPVPNSCRLPGRGTTLRPNGESWRWRPRGCIFRTGWEFDKTETAKALKMRWAGTFTEQFCVLQQKCSSGLYGLRFRKENMGQNTRRSFKRDFENKDRRGEKV